MGTRRSVDAYPTPPTPLSPRALNFRSPRELGTSVWTFSYDVLHVVYLGIAQSFISKAIWVLILSDVWGIGKVKKPILIYRCLKRMKSELDAYYAKQESITPTIKLSKASGIK